MKNLIITPHDALGDALIESQAKELARDQKYGRRLEETYQGVRVPHHAAAPRDAYDHVYEVRCRQTTGSDYGKIREAIALAEGGHYREAREVLNGCTQRYTAAWNEADNLVTFLSPHDKRHTLSYDDRRAVDLRHGKIEFLFTHYPGGRTALQQQKEPGRPGPATLERFYSYVGYYGQLPPNDFGVRDLSLEHQPRGAYAHHVGWMGEFKNRPGSWLDVVWWTTLDVIQLFDANERVRLSAAERLRKVPSGLRDFRAWEILQTEDGVDEYDADMKARLDLGDE